MIVSEFKHKNVFGAYLSDQIKQGFEFYGNGETFVFTFKQNNNSLKLYQSTGYNNCYIFGNQDGVAVGCGEKYGLFIDKNVTGGYSNPCKTFDNDILSIDPSFQIEYIEV